VAAREAVKRDTRIVASFLAAIPAALLGAAALCCWAIAQGASMHWRLAFRLICHGMVTRSFLLFQVPMPICARCTGIYIGLLGGVVAFLVWPRLEEKAARYVLFVALVPMAVDGITQATGLRESVNILRVVTGFVAAAAFGLWALSAVEHRDVHALTSS
jgi:uncharacterized membrane protein